MLINNQNDWNMYFAKSHMEFEKCLPLPSPRICKHVAGYWRAVWEQPLASLKFFFMEVNGATRSRNLDAG